MKKSKLLILGLVSCLSVLGFTSASDYSDCVSDSECLSCMCSSQYEQCSVQCEQDHESCITSCDNEFDSCHAACDGDSECEDSCMEDNDSCSSTCIDKFDCVRDSCDVDYEHCGSDLLPEPHFNYLSCFSSHLPGNEGGNNGGNEGGNESGMGDLTSQLTPVITGLTNSINEFIPYMVYIGLGVLGVVIGFFAIKRLMRYVKGSTLSVFSSRKKRK